MLAVAFTAPSTSWQNNDLMHRPSSITKAIVSAQQWDTLDFEDVNKELANKLSDDDTFAILQCISAHDVLKKLKLTGCVNLTGQGLSPLRGSVVLEQIDLCLLKKYEDPTSARRLQDSLSKDIVLPILDSIISSNGCSLKHILLPYSWREKEDDEGPMQEFSNRYDQYQENHGVSCSGCTKRIRERPWFRATNMLHYNTCYDCLKHVCEECSSNVNYCVTCKKDYCKDCDIVVKYKCTVCMEQFRAEIASLF